MTALYRSGRQADALSVYTRLRDALADELGLDPSPALHGAYLAILRHDPGLAAPGTTELAPSEPGRHVSAASCRRDLDTRRARRRAGGDRGSGRGRRSRGASRRRPGRARRCGKVPLALEAAHRAGDSGEIVWWISAGATVAAVEALGQLARALGVADHADQTIMLARLWDELRRRDRWTLVYDDCPNPEAFVALRPPAGTGTVIVTSRHRGWRRIGRVVAVDVLDDASSVHVLTSSSGDDNPVAAAELAEQMGGLPLALVQAAAFVEESG